MPDYEPHPLAERLPAMTDSEYADLLEDVRANGQREPITLYEGKILDGRNRYRACREAGVEPRFRSYDGDRPAAFVLSANLRRRHLTPSQRAMVAEAFLPALEEEARERQTRAGREHGRGMDSCGPVGPQLSEPVRATAQAAEIVGASDRSVRRARRIREEAPAIASRIERGELTLNAAERQIAKGRADRRAAQVEDVIEAGERDLRLNRTRLLHLLASAHAAVSELGPELDAVIEAVQANGSEDRVLQTTEWTVGILERLAEGLRRRHIRRIQ